MRLHKRYATAAILSSALAVSGLLVSTSVLRTSSAAFTASEANTANSFATGTITLTDDRAGVAMFDSTLQGSLDGGESVVRCVTVTLKSNLSAAQTKDVRLSINSVSSTTPALALAPHLGFTVVSADAGSGAVSPDCTTVDATHTATFASLANAATLTPANSTLDSVGTAANSYTNGYAGWVAPGNGSSKVYKITTVVENTNLAQGLNASANFVWEAR